jgi:hypothetical protein
VDEPFTNLIIGLSRMAFSNQSAERTSRGETRYALRPPSKFAIRSRMPTRLNDVRKHARKAASTGGSRAAGGFMFQARCSAYVAAHLLAGHRLGWIHGLADDIPKIIAAESGGPGDDLRITLRDGRTIEAQVKRGLTRNARLWEALTALAKGLDGDAADFGLLVACPHASKSILIHLARDLERLGDGRTDQLSDIGSEWHRRLQAIGIPVSVCGRLRIVALAATDVQPAAMRLAESYLRPLLQDPTTTAQAWAALVADAFRLIEYRGRRTIESTLRVLPTHGIALSTGVTVAAPAAILGRLCEWVTHVHASYAVIGLPASIPIDTGWIEQNGRVLEGEVSAPTSFEEALRRYRENIEDTSEREPKRSHGSAIGRFITRCVVLAGPGMGKTTLLAKLARTYAIDGQGVLKVRLSTLAERMRTTGCGFEEGLFALGLDTSGVCPVAARSAAITWTVLCDGLDECGSYREGIARDLAGLAAARPEVRIVVTSRSIGYAPGLLSGWRHYALEPLARDKLRSSVQRILGTPDDHAQVDAIVAILETSPAIRTIAASPLLLGLAVALAIRQGSIGRTEADLYQRMFGLVEEAASSRGNKAGLADVELARTIDAIGYALITRPPEAAEQSLSYAADVLSKDLGCPRLEAKRRVELAMRYWCEVGIIERIHHEDQAMLAFVHKTFGEFACARFICESAPADRRQMLIQAVGFQSDPAIEFAAALGLGREAFEVLLQVSQPGVAETVIRALSLANHISTVEVADLLEPIVERAFELLNEADNETAERIGEGLVELHPDHRANVTFIARRHLTDGAPNARLAAWSFVLGTNDGTVLRPDLLEAVASFTVAPEDKPARRSLLGGTIFTPASKLFQGFAVRAADRLLPDRDAESDNAVLQLLRSPGLSNFGFLKEFEPILDRHDRSDIRSIMREHWYGPREEGLGRFNQVDFDGWEKAAAICEISQLEALAGETEADSRLIEVPTSILPNLSAFIEICGWGGVSAGDVWCWRHEAWRDVEREVIRATVRLGIIDPDEIALEAASLLANRDAVRGHMTFSWFNRTGAVDIPPLDWTNARMLALDLWKLEQALHHGSESLVPLSANLLDVVLTKEQRRVTVERLLANGKGLALWAAAQLGADLHRDIALDLAIRRLGGPCVPGLEHVLDILVKFAPAYDDRLHALLAPMLASPRPELAMAVADFTLVLGKAVPRLQSALTKAIDHWTANPPPSSKFGNPPDPRYAIANALAAIGKLGNQALLDLLPYRRDRSSKSAVNDAVMGRWEAVPSFRDRVFERVEGGKLAPHYLSSLIEAPVKLTIEQRAAALRLAGSSDPRYRRSVIEIFGWPDFLGDTTLPVFRALLDDKEIEIRSAARRIRADEPASGLVA